MPTSPVGKLRLPMTSGGGLGRTLGEGRGAVEGAVDGAVDALTGVDDGGAVEPVGSVLGVVTAGLSVPADGVAFATGLGANAPGGRAHPLTTMTNPAMRAADALATLTPS